MLDAIRTVLGKSTVAQFAFLGLIAMAALLVWLALIKADEIASTARAQATAERDNFWSARIEKSNALAAQRQADQAERVLSIEVAANQRVREMEDHYAEMETENAALPNGDDRGLSRARVRLLNK